MPLYELFCVSAASPSSAPFRELIRSTSRLVVDNGGVVRGMQYWGRRYLPQRTKRHQQYHYEGDHFLLQFDTSPPVLSVLNSRLRADPRVVKWTALKLGEKLHEITPRGTSGGYNDLLGPPSADRAGPSGKTVMGGGNTIA
ncbi:hypothetical protein BCV69DRAFT_313173 [Microstroma glucosiphilum]|uniref:Ribosomal protein S6 n=1 Tax=Pseudomicrostroma glucosiphilum TaxID=1684307 RepID=A0A316UAB2_9BASI|nr:hypothetical protein BCV69DRAFT_313173 [Pseudomicrostroma glucosiphilum]PWN19965.1 hypothetical protein BCV69DRAFT_313173 [Pseudomicrostroma glucosiphilum]